MRRGVLIRAVCVLAVVTAAAAASSSLDSARPAGGQAVAFRRVIVIVFENRGVREVLGSPEAPTFNRLARRYAVLGKYFGVTHPSLPNYLALVSGSRHGITTDCTICTVSGRTLADTLEEAGKSWKTYAEGLPAPGFTGPSLGRYGKWHVPFLYFRNVLSSPSRLSRVVPLSSFADDLARGQLPDFALVVPDFCHDMHDCSVATGDRWLKGFLAPLLNSPQLRDGVVFVIFDEAADWRGGGGQVAALALGPLVRPGSRSLQRLNHYALLRTIEDGWSLPKLGRSASAPRIKGVWR